MSKLPQNSQKGDFFQVLRSFIRSLAFERAKHVKGTWGGRIRCFCLSFSWHIWLLFEMMTVIQSSRNFILFVSSAWNYFILTLVFPHWLHQQCLHCAQISIGSVSTGRHVVTVTLKRCTWLRTAERAATCATQMDCTRQVRYLTDIWWGSGELKTLFYNATNGDSS